MNKYSHTISLLIIMALVSAHIFARSGARPMLALETHWEPDVASYSSDVVNSRTWMVQDKEQHVDVELGVDYDPRDIAMDDALVAKINANEGQWTLTDSLTEGRHSHTATRLSDGRVLVVGGAQGAFEGPGLATVEIYDPSTETWSTTGSLNDARNYHTITLLPDGRVLVVGGWNGYPTATFASTEIYDPVSGTWSYTGSLSVARRRHTATLLADGRVLVVGGYYAIGNDTITASAEIYDPASGIWSTTGALNTPRQAHSATLLADGRVLVVGGYYEGLLASAEIYDPVSETWSNAPTPLACHGAHHTSTSLSDGRVLLVGGWCGSFRNEVEIYDPVDSTWTATASLPDVREAHSAILLPDGRVLVVGGDDGGPPRYTSALIYDPTDGTWTPADSLNIGRRSHTTTLLPNGDVLAVAGMDDATNYLNSVEIYQTFTSTLTSITPNTTVANAGDLPVVISGANLRAPISAQLGGVGLLDVTLESASTLHAIVPVASLGTGAYTLTVHSAGQALSLTHAFTVTPVVTPTQFRAMIYLACDNNLASSCQRLFNELEQAMMAAPNLRIVVLWDGPGEDDSAYYLVQPDDHPLLWAAYTDGVNRFPLGEVDTAAPSTLVGFATWAQSQYPGHYTFLSLVGHGGGWAPDLYPGQHRDYEWGPERGVGGMLWDDHPGNVMATRPLAEALSWATTANLFDVIYLDACLMSAAEVMAELSPYAQYIVAHENLTWAFYPYADFLDVDAATIPLALAQTLAGVYNDALIAQDYPGDVEAINSSALDNVLDKLATLTSVLSDTLPGARQAISETILNTAHLAENDDWAIDAQDSYVDLRDLAVQLIAHPDIPQAVQDAAQDLIAAFDAAIVVNYTHSGAPWPAAGTQWWDLGNLHGLSLYFPLADEWKRAYYDADALPRFAASGWTDFIQAWHDQPAPPPPDDEGDDNYPTPPGSIGLLIDLPALAGLGSPVYVRVLLAGVSAVDDVVGVQISVTSSNPLTFTPATNLSPRAGGLLPMGSYTHTARTETSWDFIANIPSGSEAISGTGVLVELPFYAQSTGCVSLEFATHLLVNGQTQAVNHHAIPTQVCVTHTGGLVGQTYQQGRQTGRNTGIHVSVQGAGGVFAATTNADGNFALGNIPAGAPYTVRFSHPLFVHAERTITITPLLTTTMPPVGLWAGDLNQDGYVQKYDWYICAAASIPVSDPAFDVNADGVTDVLDCTHVSNNVGRPDMPFTNPPQGGYVGALARDAQRPAATQGEEWGHLELVYGDGNVTLRVTDINESPCAAIGARILLPQGATVSDVESRGAFENGFLNWHQDGDLLYIVAAPPKSAVVAGDTDVVLIHWTGGDEMSIQAQNPIPGDPEFSVFLPLITRNARP